jgi:hypothetical protein
VFQPRLANEHILTTVDDWWKGSTEHQPTKSEKESSHKRNGLGWDNQWNQQRPTIHARKKKCIQKDTAEASGFLIQYAKNAAINTWAECSKFATIFTAVKYAFKLYPLAASRKNSRRFLS